MADISSQVDIELIKKKAVSGVVTFTLRTIFLQIFTFVSTFILTVLLNPSVFGIFFLVSAFLNFFVYFSDIGLAAALIQKKGNPSSEDYKTTFTIQQAIVLILVVLGLLFSNRIADFYNLDSDGLLLLRFLLISIVLSSLKTIPSILLERNLSFTKLVIPQIAENIVFYSTAVILAYKGFGIASFSWAVLARGFIGLLMVYLLSPWKISIGVSRSSLKELTSFGIPFQLNSILALFKDDLLTVYLGKILTFTEIGYIGWAQKWAFIPLRFFMDNVNKITFPAYSRLQSHKVELEKAIGKSLFFVTFLVYPSILGMAAITPYAISLVPSYEKWLPALPLLYLFGVNAIFSTVSTTFTNTLFAIGRPKYVLYLMVFWTSATWLLTVPLTLNFGYLGAAIASAAVSVSSVITVILVKKELDVPIVKNILGPLMLSALVFVIVKVILNLLPVSLFVLIFTIICSAIIYFAMSFAIFRGQLLKDFNTIKASLFSSK